MPGGTTPPRRLPRMTRMLAGSNPLRRRSDRIEGIVLLLLSAVFLAAVGGAAFLGLGFCRSQDTAAADLHPAVAVLSRGAPETGTLGLLADAPARWRAPDGQQRSGVLTTITVPGIAGAPAGARVRIWVTAAGQPAQPPPGQIAVVITAVMVGLSALGGAGITLVLCYFLCRRALDRRRLAAWESAWAQTGPRWTSLR